MTEEEKNKIRTRTNISVSLETRKRVGRLGYAGQSLESVLIALLDENEGRRKKKPLKVLMGHQPADSLRAAALAQWRRIHRYDY